MVRWGLSPSFNRAVAQWLEQGTHNPSVVGSIPTGPTMSRIRFQGTDLRGSKQAEIPPQQRVGTPRSSLSLLCLVGPTVILLQGLRSMHLGNGLLISLKSQSPTLFPTPLSQVGFLWIEIRERCCRFDLESYRRR